METEEEIEKCFDDDNCESVHDYLIVLARGGESAGLFFEDPNAAKDGLHSFIE